MSENVNNVKMVCGFCRAEFTPQMKAEIDQSTYYDTCTCEDGCHGDHSSTSIDGVKIEIKCSNCGKIVYIKNADDYDY